MFGSRSLVFPSKIGLSGIVRYDRVELSVLPLYVVRMLRTRANKCLKPNARAWCFLLLASGASRAVVGVIVCRREGQGRRHNSGTCCTSRHWLYTPAIRFFLVSFSSISETNSCILTGIYLLMYVAYLTRLLLYLFKMPLVRKASTVTTMLPRRNLHYITPFRDVPFASSGGEQSIDEILSITAAPHSLGCAYACQPHHGYVPGRTQTRARACAPSLFFITHKRRRCPPPAPSSPACLAICPMFVMLFDALRCSSTLFICPSHTGLCRERSGAEGNPGNKRMYPWGNRWEPVVLRRRVEVRERGIGGEGGWRGRGGSVYASTEHSEDFPS